MPHESLWKTCSSCKKPIEFGAKYWLCNVSTCNRARTALQFCKVSCWDAHLPLFRHRRSAYAVEKLAPTREAYAREQATATEEAAAEAARKTQRGSSSKTQSGVATSRDAGAVPLEILIVASRLKDYVDRRAQLQVANSVLHALSHLVRRECDLAIDAARQHGRKTVMDRDFIRPPVGTSEGEVLIVVTKMKAYVKARAGMNTSGSVADLLSADVRGWVNAAIRAARVAERGTLMDRDFDGL